MAVGNEPIQRDKLGVEEQKAVGINHQIERVVYSYDVWKSPYMWDKWKPEGILGN